MEAEPQRDTGGSSPPISSANVIDVSNIHESRGESEEILPQVSSTSVGAEAYHEHGARICNERNKLKQQKRDDNDLISESEWESLNSKLHSLRLILLEELLAYMPRLRDVGM